MNQPSASIAPRHPLDNREEQTTKVISRKNNFAKQSFEESHELITAFDATFASKTCDPQSISFEDEHLLLGDDRLKVCRRGFSQLCQRIAAPADYLRRLDPVVRDTVVRSHFDRGDLFDRESEGRRLSLLSRRGQFVGFTRPDLVNLRGIDVLNAVNDGVGLRSSDLTIRNLRFSDDGLKFDFVLAEKTAEVHAGDCFEVGLHVSHSHTALAATSIQTYMLRLLCRNGMVHRECRNHGPSQTRRLKWSPDAVDRQIAQVAELAQKLWKNLDQKVDSIRGLRSATQEITSATAAEYFTDLLRSLRLSPRRFLQEFMHAWAHEEGGNSEPTEYGLFNTVTYLATYNTRSDSPYRLTENQMGILLQAAGSLAFRRIHRCRACGHISRALA